MFPSRTCPFDIISQNRQDINTVPFCRLLQLIKDVRAKRCRMIERGKKLGLVDERYMKRAEEMLHGELAVALGMTREQVPHFISDALGDAGEPEAALA